MDRKDRLDRSTREIIGAAIAVHRALGPGLLESAYQACLAHELVHRGLRFELERPLPVVYRDVKLDCGYRLDIVVEDLVVVELKSIETVLPVHKAQLLSYLRLSGHAVGLLINFNVKILKNGLYRVVNDYPEVSAFSAGSAFK